MTVLDFLHFFAGLINLMDLSGGTPNGLTSGALLGSRLGGVHVSVNATEIWHPQMKQSSWFL